MIGRSGKTAPLFSLSRVLSSAPFFLLQNLPNLLSAKANYQQPQSPLSQLHARCNCPPFVPFSSDTSLIMFRTAVRQSTRAVGAVSAAGRVTAVSLLSVVPTTQTKPFHRNHIHAPGSAIRKGVLGAQLACWKDISSFFRALCEQSAVSGRHSVTMRLDSANWIFPYCRPEMPHPPPPTSLPVTTPPRPRHHRPRSLRSSSSASVASRRSPASLRLAVSSPLGMWSSTEKHARQWDVALVMGRGCIACVPHRLEFCRCLSSCNRIGLTLSSSDGIARVHGLANVQAEELVEYENLSTTPMLANADCCSTGSPPASRACA